MEGVFVPIMALMIPIVAIIAEYLQKKAKMRVIEKAIEHGVTLDGISLNEPKKKRLPYRAGMVLLATGIGLSIMGSLCSPSLFGSKPEMTGLMIGPGVLVGLIGVALIVNDKMNYKKFFNE